MPQIEQVTRYKFNGKEYKTLNKIKQEIEDDLGKIIDSMDVTMTPRQKLNIFNTLVSSKSQVIKLLVVLQELGNGRL
jgi:hypothetical protein